MEANGHTRRDILDKLHDEGPRTRSAFPDTTVVPWQSSGWNDNRNVRRLLDMMVRRDKLWDLAERVALLSPLDRLVFDRQRMTELFEFDYQLEMYKPKTKRRWGYWAMPVLAGAMPGARSDHDVTR